MTWFAAGDKAVATAPASTLPSLRAALSALRPGGLMSVMCYPAHAGGEDETAAVRGDRWEARNAFGSYDSIRTLASQILG